MDSAQAKLFIGGISWQTDENVLKEHFQSYGAVSGSVVARDRHTHKPRGFGFVWFSNSSSADEALKEKHVILGRAVEVKKAVPRNEEVQNVQQNRGLQNGGRTETANDQSKAKKIFVGGLPSNLTEDEFKAYFGKFGRITDVVVMHDSMTNRPRGFGFITFESVESLDSVLQNNFHEINGKRVEVKRAIPKEGNCNSIHSPSSSSQSQGGGMDPPIYSISPFHYPYSYYDPYAYCHLYPPYYHSGYEVYNGYASYTSYGGFQSSFLGKDVSGSCYPAEVNGVGHAPLVPRGAWYDPKYYGVQSFPSPYNNELVWSSKGMKLSDSMAANGVVDLAAVNKTVLEA